MRTEPAIHPGEPPAGHRRAQARYHDNLARHLIGVSRDLESRLLRALAEDCGHRDLRPSFGPLLSLIWRDGRPLTGLATELAISKQACSQLANLAEQAGYVERRPDPDDRRARRLLLTARGRSLVREAVRILLEIESGYADLVGTRAYRRFTAALAVLYRELGLPTHADPDLTAAARRSIGVLPLIAVRIQQELMEATLARGHSGLKMSHGQVLPLIGPDGGRIHEIARVQQVTRQAIHVTARDLERLGYLRRASDPRDRRGVVLTLTRRGARLIADSVAAVDGLEQSFAGILGRSRLEPLQRVARDLYRALHLEAEIFDTGQAEPGDSEHPSDIEQLASRLRRQLGRRGAARLGALLQTTETRSTT
jgi:DNA-binding MarR family transcriptional regulator